jgi:hypothetical protein
MTKIKSFIFIVIFTISVLGLYAEAPELRNVMPNSWRKVTRLSRDEETRFLQNNAGLLGKSIREGSIQADSSLPGKNEYIIGTTLVYYEPVGEEKFYRLITFSSNNDDLTKQEEKQFLQTLVYEFRGRMEILAIGGYNNGTVSESEIGEYKICKSLDIIRSGGRAKGVLTTRVMIPFNSYRKTYTFFVKGQPRGLNYSAYALMSDIKEVLGKGNRIPARLDERGIYVYNGLPYIEIDASDCLVDPNIPLRYSLQNAFDGDPSTSYVENTDDDLLVIKLAVKDITCKKITIINGYAQDMPLYKDNNRIKTIRLYYPRSSKFYDIELADNTLGWQFIETNDCDINTIEIYRGEKYNDTCIAEYNVYTDQYGWLFGDIDE